MCSRLLSSTSASSTCRPDILPESDTLQAIFEAHRRVSTGITQISQLLEVLGGVVFVRCRTADATAQRYVCGARSSRGGRAKVRLIPLVCGICLTDATSHSSSVDGYPTPRSAKREKEKGKGEKGEEKPDSGAKEDPPR